VSGVVKLGYSSLAAGLFFLLTLPWTYKVMNGVFGKGKHVLVNEGGVPTLVGVLIHSVIFLLIVFLIMKPWKTTQTCDN